MLIPKLRVLLAEKGQTISSLSKATNIPRATITAFADGRTSGIQYNTIDKICIALNVTIGDLFYFLPIEYHLEYTPSINPDFKTEQSLSYNDFYTITLSGNNFSVTQRLPLSCSVVHENDHNDFVINTTLPSRLVIDPWELSPELIRSLLQVPDACYAEISSQVFMLAKTKLTPPDNYNVIHVLTELPLTKEELKHQQRIQEFLRPGN